MKIIQSLELFTTHSSSVVILIFTINNELNKIINEW